MRLTTHQYPRRFVTLLTCLGLLSLAGCHKKDARPPFETERRYRHPLFKGGYETLQFQPDGSVFVRMLVNGEDVIANGAYHRNGSRQINVILNERPKRTFYFTEATDKELLGLESSFRWKRFQFR